MTSAGRATAQNGKAAHTQSGYNLGVCASRNVPDDWMSSSSVGDYMRKDIKETLADIFKLHKPKTLKAGSWLLPPCTADMTCEPHPWCDALTEARRRHWHHLASMSFPHWSSQSGEMLTNNLILLEVINIRPTSRWSRAASGWGAGDLLLAAGSAWGLAAVKLSRSVNLLQKVKAAQEHCYVL